MKVKGTELRLADVVNLDFVTGYDTATIKNITEDGITLFRPYVHTADFSYTSGVICYLGFEEWTIPHDDRDWDVVGSKALK